MSLIPNYVRQVWCTLKNPEISLCKYLCTLFVNSVLKNNQWCFDQLVHIQVLNMLYISTVNYNFLYVLIKHILADSMQGHIMVPGGECHGMDLGPPFLLFPNREAGASALVQISTQSDY